MACYYLVISSTHLTNGHFRSIKGVFRGPLCKSGTTLPGYAEKGKSITNALEDLKSNFYCELCDKQYHKHQEFDNHINSYDHAHKQRLKELKQREFARNVASKSWKDEKKQEKALKRLHRLAELRKQPDCVSDEGPIFKTPRLRGPQQTFFTSKDDRVANSRCKVLCKGEQTTGNSIAENKEDILIGRDVLNNNQCCFVGKQTQLPFSNISNVSNRAGVSFCFSKKALLKLDSSASVFNESTEDVNECSQSLTHKAKQMSVSIRHYVDEDADENIALMHENETDKAVADNVSAALETFKDRDSGKMTKEESEILQSNLTTELQSGEMSCTVNLNQTEADDFLKSDISSETTETIQHQEMSCTAEKCSNKHTVADAILIEQLSQLLSQKHDELEPSGNATAENPADCDDTEQIPSEHPEMGCNEPLNNNAQTSAPSCLNVLSKDGNTNLQWPTELVLFTKTEPSISYACNPLYFDFKCSPKNKFTKTNERVTKSCEEHDESKNRNEKKASGISVALEIGKDSQSSEAKREKNLLREISKKDSDSHNNYRLTKEFTQKANLCDLHENRDKISTHLDASQDCIVKESHHSGKRKRSFHDPLEHGHSLPNRFSENKPFSKDDLRSKSLNHVHLNMIANVEHLNMYSSNKNQCNEYNEKSQNKNSFLRANKSDGSPYSDSESDTSSVTYRRSSLSSQWLSSSKVFTHSDSSESSSESTWKHDNISNHKSRIQSTSKKVNCMMAKHNCDVPSKSESTPHVPDKKQKYKYRNEKHKTFRKNAMSERPLCSKHDRNAHRSRKKCTTIKNDHVSDGSQFKHINKCEDISSPCSDSGSFLKSGSLESKRGVHEQGSLNRTETKETSYKCYSENIVSVTDNCGNNTSEKIVKHIIVNEKKTLIAELLVEQGHSTKQGEKEFTSREYSEGCSMKLNNQSQRYFSVQFPQSGQEIVPLLKHVTADQTIEHRIQNGNAEESKAYEVTVTRNTNHCLFEDIIHIGAECRTINAENPTVEQQPRQLISEPFMQNSDPVHFKSNCDMPSLRHSGGTDSTETKEENKRLGLCDVNGKISPREGNGKCHYDSTMQDFSKTDIRQRVYHKSTSPPLAQQPITFSPDEVDKYRLLQLQAQQHMQKQLLSKHFKALPTNGPSVFSTAQAIQPVSVQHHPSITAIHQALMQRYAVTASMHSQVNHLPLPQLNHFPHSQFPPVALSSLTPTLFPAHPAFLTGHPLHLVSTAAIHPAHLTIQAIPHAALIPTIFTPHPNAAMHPSIQLHPFVHPLFQGQDFHFHSGSNPPH
ncbi:zinc finger protein 804B [Pelodytes ibericus]